MARPDIVRPLVPDPALPPGFMLLADTTLRHPLSTADHLLVLADGCDEAIASDTFDHIESEAIRTLADELRLRAPEYACP